MLLVLGKGELVLILNELHTPYGNDFFMVTTLMGEYIGLIAVFLAIAMFSTKRNVAIFLVTVVLTLLLSQGFKHLVFNSEHRPSFFFENLEQIEGLTRHKHNSFPSGHTAMAFALYTILAIAIPKKGVQLTCAVVATLTGISRVYLGQHYLNDIVTGAILGMLTTVTVVYLFDKYRPVRSE